MKEWFLATGYPEIVVNNQIDKVHFGRDQSVKKNSESGIFVTNYRHKVKELWKLIRDLHPFLYSDGEMVRSKLYPVERMVRSQGCGSSRCQVCKSINITDEFTSSTTNKSIK